MVAKPQYYPDWATDDVNLPSTGKTNKVRPREVIRTTGWDKGQIPTAEEMNWMFNNWGLWIHYFQDEYLPTLPETYLPKNGTNLVFSGDLTGQINWVGGNQGTGDIQVVDNSHEHLSQNISDATFSPEPNVLSKRGQEGQLSAALTFYGYAPDNKTFDYAFVDQVTGQVKGGIGWGRNSDVTILYSGSGTERKSGVYAYSGGYVDIDNPRASGSQETKENSLVRLDYMENKFSDFNTAFVNFINSKSSISLNGDSGVWRDLNTGYMVQWGRGFQNPRDDGDSRYLAFPTQFPNNCFNVQVTHSKTNTTPWAPTISPWCSTPTLSGVNIRAENNFYWVANGN